jgi:hypothetical protein
VHLNNAEANLPQLLLKFGCLRSDRRGELLQRAFNAVDPRQRFGAALGWVD